MFIVTAEALQMIGELTEHAANNKRLTIFSSGVGCGGPALKVDMELPLKDDIPETISGCTFYIRSAIYKFLEASHLDAVETFWGKRLYVKTTYTCIG